MAPGLAKRAGGLFFEAVGLKNGPRVIFFEGLALDRQGLGCKTDGGRPARWGSWVGRMRAQTRLIARYIFITITSFLHRHQAMKLHPEQPRTGNEAVDRLVAHLFAHLESDPGNRYGQREVPDELREQIVAADAPMTQALLAILADRELSWEDAPGEGWIVILAPRLLAARGDEAAIEPMIELLSECHWETWLYGELISALQIFGKAAFGPTLRALEAAEASGEDPEDEQGFRGGLLEVLINVGVHDDRVYERLLTELHEDIELGASHLGTYGDERALEPLSRVFDGETVDESGGLGANQHVLELSDAIRRLGGSLSDAQRAKVRRADRMREESRGRPQPVFGAPGVQESGSYTKSPREDIGRNAPCPCGSGKKYKRCCLRR